MEKILLPVNEDSWGVAAESVWAEQLNDGLFRVQNIPFFAEGYSIEDVVEVRTAIDGAKEAFLIRKRSPYSVILCNFDTDSGIERLTEFLKENDLRFEIGHDKTMMAIAVDSGQRKATLSFLARLKATTNLGFGEVTFRKATTPKIGAP